MGLLADGIVGTPFLGYLETLAASVGTVPEVVLHFFVPVAVLTLEA
ncbi:hypothetical protein ABZT51_48180 [Streptomyces sp. NPDC005373]